MKPSHQYQVQDHDWVTCKVQKEKLLKTSLNDQDLVVRLFEVG